MALKSQVITLKVFFDDSEHEAPENWSWSGLIDGRAELVDYQAVEHAEEEDQELSQD